MHFEFLVEERSAEAALENIVPRIIGSAHTFRIHSHQGKPDLLKKLAVRLRGYTRFIPKDWRIVVLVDKDAQDCVALKAQLDRVAGEANLVTKTAAAGRSFVVLNRIAVEELEAWLFGDVPALVAAYPRISPTLDKKEPYRDPDGIRGGTAEALRRVLRRAGYYTGSSFPKIDAATRISAHMDPTRNRSRSFGVFRDGLLETIRSP